MNSIKFFLLFIFILNFWTSAFAQGEKITHKVFLVGNICDVSADGEFLKQLENVLSNTSESYTLLLNGDLTNADLGTKTGALQIEQIKSLIRIVHTTPQGKIILSAGDRDWKSSKKGGQKRFNQLEKAVKKFIKKGNYKRAKWANKNGCPGPKTYDLDESLLLIVVNSQWWNHPFDKPRAADGLCTVITHDDFKEELESEVKENLDKNIIIAGHHPFESLGNYGGYFSFVDQMKPLPILGSFKTAFHKNIGTAEDISNENLYEYREELRNLFFFYKNIIYVSAHEKNQQIIKDGKNYMLNSGAPTKGKYAANHVKALLSTKRAGLLVLNYYDSGKVETIFLERKKDGFQSKKKYTLFESSCFENENFNSKTPLNYSFRPCEATITPALKMSKTYGNTTLPAGAEYKSGLWKRIWLGNHYRTTWTKPVTVPTLNLDTMFGGLTIYKKGGGRQTTSLKFKSADGTQYTFRSVNKDPSKAFNYILRPTFITPLFRDQTSSQNPYGAMIVAPLLDEIGILHASPTLYVLPDDKKLGIFQKKYAHLFGMLEDNPSKPNDAGEVFGGADKIYQSNKLYRKLYKTRKNRIDEKEFIKARIFDILIGDWSKHEDNWKWAGYKEEQGILFRPIPRDRDHAFSRQDGIIPWYTNRPWIIRNIETFEHKIKGLKSLMFQAVHMDRFLSTSATREDWIAAAKDIQANISDKEIEQAVQNMPPEVMELSGKTITSKLKARIKDLDKYAEDYYMMLAEYVDIIGSNDKEYFEIIRQKDGNINVKIFNIKKDQKGSLLFYDRTFFPKETKEIRIYGLGEDDIFDIQGVGKSSIIIRLLGGPGDDFFKSKNEKAKTKTLLYDKGKGTTYDIAPSNKIVKHWNKEIYEYDRTYFDYHRFAPIWKASYSNFNGLSLIGGASFVRQKFGKEDYSSKHLLEASVSTKLNWTMNYKARFHQVLRDWDIPLEVDFSNPEFRNNFYGIGNSTKLDHDLLRDNFYKLVHRTFHIETGIGKEFWRKSKFDVLVGYERSKFDDLENSILSGDTTLFGYHTTISEIPVKAKIEIDFRDQSGFPYDGIFWKAEYKLGTILSGAPQTTTYGVASSSLEYFISNKNKNPITIGLRIGGAVSHGDVPFYHLPNIGGRNGLRGFTGERFTSKSSVYFNSELRWQIFERYTALVPIKFGVKAFFDTGRVEFGEREDSATLWHSGYGFGVFVVPLYEAVSISLLVGFSEEESFYPVISFGKTL